MSLKRGFEGMLFCWGCGELGQDGHGGTAVVKSEDGLLDAFTPQKLGRVKLFACGSSHSVVVTVDNRIFAWGNGSSGQLGSGERSMKTYPVEAFLPSNRDDDVTAIEVAGVACGSRHTFIWTQSGHAYSFGNNFYAQLGYDFRKVDFKEHQLMPHLLRTLVFHKVKQVACGERHTLFALEDGKVAACGINDYGQIGTDAQEDATVPRILEDFDNVSKIACGANHNLAVTGDGKVFMWGCGRACGNLKRDLRLPEQVDIPHSRVIAVSGGCWHSLLLTDDGNMYSWGTGQEGQLGHGETTTFLSKPQLLCSELLKGAIRKIDAGDCYSSALTANGELFMWGRNCHVIDGNQPASHKFWSPQKADVSNQAVCDISCGSWHTMILTGIPKGRSPGNKESDFRETGASFKDDSNYPQLIELLPKENSSRKHTGDLQAPPNQAEVLLHSQSSQPSSQPKNSPFDGMDQTDLNRKNHSDGTTVQDASALSAKEKQGNSCSSIKLQEENVRVLIPRGKRFRNRQAFSCLRSPLIPDCLCSGDADYPNTLPEMRRKPKCRSRPQTAGSPWTSSRQPGNGDSSSSTNFSKASHQSGRIPGREPGCALHPRARPEGQESGPRHGSRPRTAHPHLSPLASHSTASSSLIVTLNPSERLAGRPVYQQAIYSSGTAWKHISRSPDPVLSQKRPASETIQQSSQK